MGNISSRTIVLSLYQPLQVYMTHLQFRKMDEHKQFETIDESGVLLFDRKEKFHTIRVYQVSTFFVEVYVHTHFNVPLKVKSFPATQSAQLNSHHQVIGNICPN